MTEATKRKPYAVAHGLPQFTFDEEKLREGMALYEQGSGTGGIAPVGDLWSTDADDIHRSVMDACDFGAITGATKWEIVIYPTDLGERDAFLVTVWSTTGLASSHVVASSIGIKEAATRQEWDEADPATLTVAVLKTVVATANSAAAQMVGAEAGERLVRRHYEETRDGHGSWWLKNPLAAENNAIEDSPTLEESISFDSASEAADYCDRLIFTYLTKRLNSNLEGDVPIDLGLEEFAHATQRLEQFRRGDVETWCLFQTGPTPQLEFIA